MVVDVVVVEVVVGCDLHLEVRHRGRAGPDVHGEGAPADLGAAGGDREGVAPRGGGRDANEDVVADVRQLGLLATL